MQSLCCWLGSVDVIVEASSSLSVDRSLSGDKAHSLPFEQTQFGSSGSIHSNFRRGLREDHYLLNVGQVRDFR